MTLKHPSSCLRGLFYFHGYRQMIYEYGMAVSKNLRYDLEHPISKEWHNVSHHLKELKDDDEIPTSQKIDWNSSEEENEAFLGKRNLSIIRSKCKYKNVHDGDRYCEGSSKSANYFSKSPILKAKHNKSPSLSRKSKNNLRILFNTSSNILDDAVIKNLNKNEYYSSSKNKSGHDENTKLLLSVKNKPNPSSPVLRPKLKNKYDNSLSVRNTETKNKCAIFELKHSSPKPMNINSNYEEDNYNKIQDTCVILSDNSISNSYDLCDTKIEISSEIRSNKHFKANDSSSDDLKLAISDCLSPVASSQIEENITTQENDSLVEQGRKGSEWVKALKETTPEKSDQLMNPKTDLTKFELDSAKKKIQKNGFAHQLQKLIYFWKSNVTMWNHQMSLASANNEICCSQSPDAFYSQKVIQNNPRVASPSPPWFRTKSKTRFDRRSLCSLFLKGNEIQDVKLKQVGLTSPCVRNLKDSLDLRISEDSESSVKGSLEIGNCDSAETPKSNFVIPKKHVCVKILKIEWQNAVTISALCREIDKCSVSVVNPAVSQMKSKSILGIFGRPDIKSEKQLEVGSTVKIFAPWQVLETKSQPYVMLFTSYYVITGMETIFDNCKKGERLTKIATWECTCTTGSNIIPAMCTGGKMNVFCGGQEGHSSVNSQSAFNSVMENNVISSPKCERCWTILEAIEQCGGLPDIPVSLTIRIRRIYNIRSDYDNTKITHYMVLGQDPSGTFAVLEIPNRPLKITLKSFLEEGVNTTRTLTHLSMQQRIIKSQDPELFSLITSLQSAYNQSITNNLEISTLLQDQLQRPPQSFCYKFVANLGQTVDYKIAESEAVGVILPRWTLCEASQLDTGRRGSICATILYYVHPNLYVSCGEVKTSVRRFIVRCKKSFPEWINCDGTIMVPVVIEDILVWRGTFVLDTFSRLQRLEDNAQVLMSDLLKLVPVLKKNSIVDDLVALCGVLKGVNDSSAYVWEECNICRGSKLHSINADNLKCQTCNTEHIEPMIKYSLQVETLIRYVDGTEGYATVTLFQSTIKSILKDNPKINNQYSIEAVLNTEIGPLICYVKSVEITDGKTKFILVELPY